MVKRTVHLLRLGMGHPQVGNTLKRKNKLVTRASYRRMKVNGGGRGGGGKVTHHSQGKRHFSGRGGKLTGAAAYDRFGDKGGVGCRALMAAAWVAFMGVTQQRSVTRLRRSHRVRLTFLIDSVWENKNTEICIYIMLHKLPYIREFSLPTDFLLGYRLPQRDLTFISSEKKTTTCSCIFFHNKKDAHSWQDVVWISFIFVSRFAEVLSLLALSVDRAFILHLPTAKHKFRGTVGMKLVVLLVWIFAAFMGSIPIVGWSGIAYYKPRMFMSNLWVSPTIAFTYHMK